MDSCDKIVIFGQTVQVPPNRVAYNAIRMDFIRMANEAAVQYEKLYKQDGSIQKVINGLGEQMHDCLAPTLDHCITTLIQHGVIDIDVQTFAERYIQITLPSYGVLAFIGAFAALLFLYFRLDRFDIAFTQFLKLVALCAVGCVLGSKLMYALTQVPWLIENFSVKNLLMLIPNSGYVFYGGLLGVILAIYLYAKKGPDLRGRIYRMVVPAFPLFHGFGRIGCFMAGCCYGVKLATPAELFGIFTLDRLPVQLIEAGFEFLLFAVLLFCEKKQSKTDTLQIYLVTYAIFRFCIEFFRGDAIRGFFLGFSTAQWVSLAIIICYVYRHFKTCRTGRETEAIQSELHPSDTEKGEY